MDMFDTCGSPCHREIGSFGGGGKNHLCSKNGLNGPLRNAVIFSTTSKSPQFWHTWSVAQTKLGFQGFIFFWIFLNLYCPLDWLNKTSVYTSRGHCKIFFSKFSFIDMFGTYGSLCHREIGWFGGGGKNHLCSKNGLSRPNGPSGMRWFFRPPPNHLNFGTHDLSHKQG